MIPSYPSPQQIGSRNVRNLFDGPVVVQEKVDGSQISFGLDSEGNLRVRSRGAELNLSSPDKMFAQAIAKIESVKHQLLPSAVYRGEYLAKPRHNVLAYDRVPVGNIALFDVCVGTDYQAGLSAWAAELGMESVPVIYAGALTPDALRPFLDRVSFLGGAKIEGVVVKNYALAKTQEHFSGKFVSEAFKEVHGNACANTDGKSVKDDRSVDEQIIASFGTTARWMKAVQHLREAGKITDSPKDIGSLVKEVQSDIETDCKEEILERLWQAHQAQLKAGFVNGLALWYKDQLLQNSIREAA